MRVEQHQISETHPYFKECDRLCWLTKNLYNKTIYDLRQIYFHNQKVFREKKGKAKPYPTYAEYCKAEKHSVDAQALHSHIVQSQLKKAFDNWNSFWKALVSYSKNPSKFKARPKVPNYKDPEKGRFLCIFRYTAVSQKALAAGYITPARTAFRLPFINRKNCKKLCEVRIVPKLGYYVIEIVYEEHESDIVQPGRRAAALDPGLNNLATVVITQLKRALIVNGRPAKAINAYYNKQIANAKSELPTGTYSSKKINRLWRRRHNRLKDYMHKASTALTNVLYKNKVKMLAIGHNEGQKQEINLGKKTNQNFVMLPRTMFNSMLKYKCEDQDIHVVLHEESYTSKASAIDNDLIPTFGKKPEDWVPSGKRVKRGLYRSKDGTRINADVNAAVNILRKVVRKELNSDWIKGLVATPARLRVSL